MNATRVAALCLGTFASVFLITSGHEQRVERVLSRPVVRGIGPGKTPGGYEPVPTDDKRVEQAAEFAVADLNSRSNCLYQAKLVAVMGARLKVVDGNEFQMNITNCMYRPQDAGLADPCQGKRPQVLQRCQVTVVVHPWEAQKSALTAFACTQCG